MFPLRDGSTMTGAAFLTIGEKGAKLSEIIPGGYENNPMWTDPDDGGGCVGYILCQILTPQGKVATDKEGNRMEFSWNQKWSSKTGWKAAKYWIQETKDGDEYIIGEDAEIILDPGQGLWIKVTQDFNVGMKVTYAGDALLESGTVPLRDGSTPVVVPLSKDTLLSQLIPGGYENNPMWTDPDDGGGCVGYILCQFLTAQGKVDTDKEGNRMEFSWNQKWSSKNGWKAAKYWIQETKDGDEYIIGEDTDVTIPVGYGLWIKVTQDYNNGMLVTGPGLEDEVEE